MFSHSTFSRLIAVSVFAIGAARGASVFVAPASADVSVGQVFELDVNIAGVSDLYAYQFDLGFDPTILQATSMAEGSFLSAGGTTLFFAGDVDNTGGTITTTADSLETAISGVPGDGTLVAFLFEAIASGTSSITLSNPFLLDSNLTGIQADLTNGSVNVSATPEPSTLLLLFSAALASLLRYRNQISVRRSQL
jgi:adhesin HecA-like repeat protein